MCIREKVHLLHHYFTISLFQTNHFPIIIMFDRAWVCAGQSKLIRVFMLTLQRGTFVANNQVDEVH